MYEKGQIKVPNPNITEVQRNKVHSCITKVHKCIPTAKVGTSVIDELAINEMFATIFNVFFTTQSRVTEQSSKEKKDEKIITPNVVIPTSS